jgi:hypothetical protein
MSLLKVCSIVLELLAHETDERSFAAKNFIKTLLHPDPVKRSTAAQAYEDPVRPVLILLPFL